MCIGRIGRIGSTKQQLNRLRNQSLSGANYTERVEQNKILDTNWCTFTLIGNTHIARI